MKKNYILDTSVLMTSPYALMSFDDNNVYLVDVTLEELDNNKTRLGEAGANAREAIRLLEGLRLNGNLYEGVPLETGLQTPAQFKILVSAGESGKALPDTWPAQKADNRILLACQVLAERKDNPTILVSNDIALRVKANLLGLEAQEYQTGRVENTDKQYKGRRIVYASCDALNSFYEAKCISPLDTFTYNENNQKESCDYVENEFVLIQDELDEHHTALARFDGAVLVPLQHLKDMPYGISPRNVGQKFAMEALLTPAEKAPLVILKGAAGTAKTFLSLACGLDRTVDHGEYRRILVCRPNQKFDDDIGYLKGDESAKIEPLIRPVRDNLEQLVGSKNNQFSNQPVEELFDREIITAQAMAYMRGRSIADTWIIIDEAQNMTPLQAFGIISRAGIGSKIVLAGDPDQIDNPHVDSRTNGLSFASERMKGSPLCWQVSFEDKECVRSELAKSAIQRLSPKGMK